MAEVVLVTALGPNPAPLVELAWALARDGQTAGAAHLVELARTAHFIDVELLAQGAALDQLHECIGVDVLPRERISRYPAALPDGTLLTDDASDEHAAIYAEAIWRAARAAQREAKERSVVFALAGGRRRTATALVTTAFQLLARPQDVCRDVRLDVRAAESGSGFFFPTQPQQMLNGRDPDETPFRAADVRIAIPEVRVPKLRALLRDADLESYAAAFAASEARISEAVPPLLRMDFRHRAATIDGHRLSLSEPRFLWLGALAVARGQGDGWLDSDDERIRTTWLAASGYWKKLRDNDAMEQTVLLQWLKGTLDTDFGIKGAPLRKLRADVRTSIEEFCDAHQPSWSRWLTPEAQKRDAKTRQRLPLSPDRIEVVGLSKRGRQ